MEGLSLICEIRNFAITYLGKSRQVSRLWLGLFRSSEQFTGLTVENTPSPGINRVTKRADLKIDYCWNPKLTHSTLIKCGVWQQYNNQSIFEIDVSHTVFALCNVEMFDNLVNCWITRVIYFQNGRILQSLLSSSSPAQVITYGAPYLPKFTYWKHIYWLYSNIYSKR